MIKITKCKSCGRNLQIIGIGGTINDEIYCKECFPEIVKKENEDFEEKFNNILISSAHFLQNKNITRYFDLITSEVVIGTGPLTEISGAMSNFIGTRSDGFEGKLSKAKKIAIKEIKYQTYEMGANAVIAVDIDYMEIGKNMLMVVISGTPVIYE